MTGISARLTLGAVLLLAIAAPSIGQVSSRIRLAAPTTFWFDLVGNNNNDGLSTATPKADPQALLDMVADNYDAAGFKITLKSVTAATYHNVGILTTKCVVGQGDKAASATMISGAENVEIDGSGSSFVLDDVALQDTDRGYMWSIGGNTTGESAPCTRMSLSHMTMSATIPHAGLVYANGGVWKILAGVTFGAVTNGHHMLVDNPSGKIIVGADLPNAPFNSPNSYKISGGALRHCFARAGSSCILQSVNLDCQGIAAAFPQGFASVRFWGQWYGSFSHWNNCQNVTGKRFWGDLGGGIVTSTTTVLSPPSGTNYNFFPGDQPGTTADLLRGAQYD